MDEFEFEQEKPKSTNRSVAPTECETCGGDRFVVYSLRPAEQSTWMKERGIVPSGHYEEYAACPDCGPEMIPQPGRPGRNYPDRAQVRERLSQ